jgi:hypothetical protein
MDMGLDPDSQQARRAIPQVRANVKWEHAGQDFFAGEVEPCINGLVVALGSWFGEDMTPVVDLLLREQMEDGGWNCEQENGSVRGSFNTTIRVLEGLLQHERRRGATPALTDARRRGEEYLLSRHLLRRRSTGQLIDLAWTHFAYPPSWHYDVLRGLDHLRDRGARPDARVAEAIGVVEGRRAPDGRWPLGPAHEGELYVRMDEGEGLPSRWNTLRALRVLRWYDDAQAAPSARASAS